MKLLPFVFNPRRAGALSILLLLRCVVFVCLSGEATCLVCVLGAGVHVLVCRFVHLVTRVLCGVMVLW